MVDAGFRRGIQDTGSMIEDEQLQTPTRLEGWLGSRFHGIDPAPCILHLLHLPLTP
jgi:hypothetical protein